MNTLTLFIVILGTATVVLSIIVACWFRTHRRRIPGDPAKLVGALSWQLWGEALLGLGTLTFSVAAHFEWLPEWPSAFKGSLRLMMFLATSVTTAHLFWVVYALHNSKRK